MLYCTLLYCKDCETKPVVKYVIHLYGPNSLLFLTINLFSLSFGFGNVFCRQKEEEKISFIAIGTFKGALH